MLTTEFEKNGFFIIRKAIEQDLIDKANAQINEFKLHNYSKLNKYNIFVENMFQRVVDLHLSIKTLQEIFSNAMDAGHEICDQYGEATLYTSLFFEIGSQQPLHRDTPYFYSGSKNGYLGVWVALDDTDENNGALIAVEGSHKLPEPNLEELKNNFYPNEDVPSMSTPLFNAYNESLLKEANDRELTIKKCFVNRGDMIIWHPSTLHGGLPHNDKTRTRRSFVMHITPRNMPMKHMDYFFHRDKPIGKVKRKYRKIVGGRLINDGKLIDFAHKKSFTVKELGNF